MTQAPTKPSCKAWLKSPIDKGALSPQMAWTSPEVQLVIGRCSAETKAKYTANSITL